MISLEQFGSDIYDHKVEYSGFSYQEFLDNDFNDVICFLDYYLEDIEGDYDDILLEAKKAIDMTKAPHLQYYKGYLQLSANQVLWDIPIMNDADEEFYIKLVDIACDKFKEQTGVEVECLGRSSRHICVENTYENAKNFFNLCDVQRNLQDWVVNTYLEKTGYKNR